MAVSTKQSQGDIYATIAGLAGTWATVSGGQRSATATKVRDGGAPNSESLMSHPEYGDLTVGRPWDRARDLAAWKILNAGVGRLLKTITVFISDPDGVVTDKITYTGRLLSVTPGAGDASATAAATLETVWSIDAAA